MASYFRNVPNFDYISRIPGKDNLDDYVEVKNIFKRGKIRDDIFGNLKFFQKYNIVGDERPDQVAQKIYNDPTLDWVVLLANNITNVYEEWPKTQYSFDKYLLEKYGSYENLYGGIHHYETIQYKSRSNITIIPSGKRVNVGFYKAPEYTIEKDPNIILPSAVQGDQAEATATIRDSVVVNLNLTNAGTGYTSIPAPTVAISTAPTGVVAIATAILSLIPGEREVASVNIINSGRGYTFQPIVTFSNPPATVPPELTAVLGVGGTVASVSIGNSGDGYTFTPTLSFSFPDDIIGNAVFLNSSPQTINTGLEGMYVSPNGDKIYTAHGAISYTQGRIEEYTLSTEWDITTAGYVRTFNLTTGASFTYATGVEFKPDGTKMYVSGLTNSGYKVAQYNLSVPWDISSAVYITSISVVAPSGVRLQDNGKYLYILDANNPDTVRKYRLATAWNISSLVPTEDSSLNISALTGNVENWFLGISFSEDGTELYAGGNDTDNIYVFTLAGAWDISSATLKTQLDASAQDQGLSDVFVNPQKTRVFISGATNRKIYEYDIDLIATGYVTLSGESIGSVVITNPGGGYTIPPQITIQPPIPSRPAIGYAVIGDGKVNQIVVSDAGYNYKTPPSIFIDSPLEPINATAIAKVEDGKIVDLILTNAGRGYESAPTVTISPAGNTYEPQVDEIFEQDSKEWRYDGYNWYRRISYGTLYYDRIDDKIVEIPGSISSKPVTNYEYEESIENSKRTIYILKGDYLNIIFNDLDDFMPYKKGSEQYVSRTLKKGDNPRLYS